MCDTLVAVTADGLLFAKNSDRDPNEAQVLEWIGRSDHADGADVACTWIAVPQVAHTHAVLVSRPWWMWGAEMGANEHGVVIGNEAVYTRAGAGPPALLGMDLVRLALERAATAHEAVGVLVGLLERHGQGGPCSHERPDVTYDNSFLVADADGAVVVETAGRHWATEEVRGPGRAISNGLTIPGFARAHSRRLRTWKSAGTRRRAVTEPLAKRATGPADLMAALRCHGDGPSPRWSRVHGGLAAPCVHAGGVLSSSQTTASWVADLRNGARHWATGTGAPCTSLFVPVDVLDPVDTGPAPTNRFDRATRWWRHELLHRTTLGAYDARLDRYRGARDAVEARWLAERPESTSALAEADLLEARWLADVAGVSGRDLRPPWVRRTWDELDRAAGIDRALVGSGTPPI
jgi:secernin